MTTFLSKNNFKHKKLPVYGSFFYLRFIPLSIIIFLFSAIHQKSNAQSEGIPSPAPTQEKSILLRGGILHVGNGEVIDNSVVGFKEGKIVIAGSQARIKVEDKEFDEVINVNGKHIYPGFIAPNSTLGLTEIEAVRATRDFNETGQINPHVRSAIAYNAESRIIPTVRNNGVLLAQVTPRQGLIAGTSSVVELDAWNWEDAVYREDDGIHLNWPDMFRSTGWWAEPGITEVNKEYEKQVSILKSFFSEAKAYSELTNPETINLKLEAMRGIFTGEKTLYINANYVKELSEAINFSREFKVKKLVFIGGADAHLLVELLRENNIAIILGRVHSLPQRPDDDIDLPYKLPSVLQKAGVLYCLSYEGGMEAMGTRNLPFTAGTAVNYGLTPEQAVMAITLNAARILGIDKTAGSIEVGKDATIIVSTGDALDMRSNNIELAFIRGKRLTLDDPQRQLFRKYTKKYNNSQKD